LRADCDIAPGLESFVHENRPGSNLLKSASQGSRLMQARYSMAACKIHKERQATGYCNVEKPPVRVGEVEPEQGFERYVT
jgi:hypothetical protein